MESQPRIYVHEERKESVEAGEKTLHWLLLDELVGVRHHPAVGVVISHSLRGVSQFSGKVRLFDRMTSNLHCGLVCFALEF